MKVFGKVASRAAGGVEGVGLFRAEFVFAAMLAVGVGLAKDSKENLADKFDPVPDRSTLFINTKRPTSTKTARAINLTSLFMLRY